MAAELQEVVIFRKQVTAARRPCGNSLSLWERIDLDLCTKAPKRNGNSSGADTRKRRREVGTAKMNKSKTKPVSSWRCQRQAAGAMNLSRVRGCTW